MEFVGCGTVSDDQLQDGKLVNPGKAGIFYVTEVLPGGEYARRGQGSMCWVTVPLSAVGTGPALTCVTEVLPQGQRSSELVGSMGLQGPAMWVCGVWGVSDVGSLTTSGMGLQGPAMGGV